MKKVSKFLALILRHNPEAGNITLDKEGWASVSDVMKAIHSKYGAFSRTDLEKLVADCDKQRYKFNERKDKIRANQGHSVEVDLKLQPTTPPAKLFHGTKSQFLDSIMKEGLTKRSRQHVHLSKDIETAKIVANRRTGNSIILEVDTSKVAGDFYQSDNGVWLTDTVPPQALTVIA